MSGARGNRMDSLCASQMPTSLRISFQYVTVQGPSIQWCRICTIPDEGVGEYK